MNKPTSEVAEKAYLEALEIREGRAYGFWVPRIWAAALRGHTDAMIELADWLTDDPERFRPPFHGYTAGGFYRRAFRKGNTRAAYNLAMNHFNRNDLHGYRHWLRKAGRAGDNAAQAQASHFETRLPHNAAAKIRRKRPELRRDEFA